MPRSACSALHHRLEAPAFDRMRRRLRQPRHALVGRGDRLPVFGKSCLRARESKVQRCQPAIESLAPRGLAGIANVVPQQETLELMPGLGTGVDRILARAGKVANRLVGRIRNPYRAQLPGTRELGQPQAIPVVGLDAVPGALRDQRRRNHLAVIASRRQRALQAVAGGPGLVDHLYLSRLTVARQQLDQLRSRRARCCRSTVPAPVQLPPPPSRCVSLCTSNPTKNLIRSSMAGLLVGC